MDWGKTKRPRRTEDIVLHKDIRNRIGLNQNGLLENYLFHGQYGKGKSLICDIIKDVYGEGNYYEVDCCGLKVDEIRTSIEPFMNGIRGMGDGNRVLIIFDEIDKVSKESSGEMARLLTEYPNASIVGTTNFLAKVPGDVLSRFTKVGFDLNKKQLNEIKDEIYSFYRKNAELEVEDNVIDFLFKNHKESLRDGLKHFQNLHIQAIKDGKDVITSDMVSGEDAQEMKDLFYSALFSEDGSLAIAKTIEDYGVDLIETKIGKFLDVCLTCNMLLARERIILDVMHLLPNLQSIYIPSNKKLYLEGILYSIRKAAMSDPMHTKLANLYRKKHPILTKDGSQKLFKTK